MTEDKLYSEETEGSLLGAIILEDDALSDIIDILPSDVAFHSGANKLVYTTLLEMHNAGQSIDAVTLSDRMKQDDVYDRAGGKQHIVELMDHAGSTATVKQYAKNIHDRWVLRELRQIGLDLSERVYHGSIEELINSVEERLYAVIEHRSPDDVRTIRESMVVTMPALNDIQQNAPHAKAGHPTGYPSLDKIISGLHGGELVVLAGRTGDGKTSFALNISRQLAYSGKNVYYASLEMAHDELSTSLLCQVGGVDRGSIRQMGFDNDLMESLMDASAELCSKRIWYDTTPALTVQTLRSRVRRVKHKEGLDCIVVDYLQLMVPSNVRGKSRSEQVSEISRQLKHLARELDTPILALSQLNRSSEHEGREPRLSDLRESGAIEQDADVVLLLHTPPKIDVDGSSRDNDGVVRYIKLKVSKQRHGPTGWCMLKFNMPYLRFEDMEKGEKNE